MRELWLVGKHEYSHLYGFAAADAAGVVACFILRSAPRHVGDDPQPFSADCADGDASAFGRRRRAAVAAGIVVLAISTYGFTLLTARFFRADTLLSGASLTWRRLRSELRR